MYSCSLSPSSFQDPLPVFFCPALCLTGWPPEWHRSGPLAIWLPSGFSQWQAQTRAWWEEVKMRYSSPCACAHAASCLATGLTVTVFCYDLDPFRQPFWHTSGFFPAIRTACPPLTPSNLGWQWLPTIALLFWLP